MRSLMTYAWARGFATAGVLTAGSFLGSRVGDAVGIAYVMNVQKPVHEEASTMGIFGYAKYTPVIVGDIAGGLIGLGTAIAYRKRRS